MEGVQDPPDRVAVAPHFGGQLAITPRASPTLTFTHSVILSTLLK